MHLVGQFLCFPNIVILIVIDMFIGFLSYTNDAILENNNNDLNISLLDTTVLEALDIK